ncbi:MAG: tRNA preQ1(34) S-adenosylmethionine ribosyltransferase-isomerase QueA [Kiritimatiellae bacterium]|nr:tRNA preQ1(34) S-adenosylmethionine ribosyltransferase-isomerase QueA [Kiritimatiellia bacterium]
MKTSDFDYHLPPHLIAQEPLPNPTDARMMVLHRRSGGVEHRHVRDLPEYLRPGDVLVVNNTRVIPARVFGRRMDTGARVEVLFLGPVRENAVLEGYEVGNSMEWFLARSEGTCRALCRSRSRLQRGTELLLADARITAKILGREDEGVFLLHVRAGKALGEILDEKGMAPLPPYIKRSSDDPRLLHVDRQRYQTVYAQRPGAVAAPTAGLHLSHELLKALTERGVRIAPVTLHVGVGTFQPVRAKEVEHHRMHEEWYGVTEDAAEIIRECRATGGRVVAVGTTTARTLETIAIERGEIVASTGFTRLFIYPPYHFRSVDVLLTNFHLPRSTLIMMVAAFADSVETAGGEGARDAKGSAGEVRGIRLVLEAYRTAIREKYRFYSYGDCMLLL